MKNYVEAFTKPKEYCIEHLQKPLALSAIPTTWFLLAHFITISACRIIWKLSGTDLVTYNF